MERYKALEDQLKKTIKNHEEAKELEKLAKEHRRLNGELKKRTSAAIKKELKGQIVKEDEQAAIDSLAKQQEKVYRKIADKILNK